MRVENSFYSREQAASYLGVSRSYVEAWVEKLQSEEIELNSDRIPLALLEQKKAELARISEDAREQLARLTMQYKMGY